MEILNFNINSDDEGQRIDKYLSNIIEGKSRSFIQGLIDEKKVKANNKVIKSNYKVKKDDFRQDDPRSETTVGKVTHIYGIRPVIALKNTALVKGGDGKASSPYIVG